MIRFAGRFAATFPGFVWAMIRGRGRVPSDLVLEDLLSREEWIRMIEQAQRLPLDTEEKAG